MRLWAALYGIIWVVLLEFLLAMKPNPGPILTDAHMLVGLLIVVFTYSNFRGLRATTVPGRVKRVARASFQLSIVMVVLGLLVWVNFGTAWAIGFGLTIWDFVLFLHIVNAFAIITQAAAVAIAYDMWEDGEFSKTTAPGEVPPPPMPASRSGLPKP